MMTTLTTIGDDDNRQWRQRRWNPISQRSEPLRYWPNHHALQRLSCINGKQIKENKKGVRGLTDDDDDIPNRLTTKSQTIWQNVDSMTKYLFLLLPYAISRTGSRFLFLLRANSYIPVLVCTSTTGTNLGYGVVRMYGELGSTHPGTTPYSVVPVATGWYYLGYYTTTGSTQHEIPLLKIIE